MTSPQKAPSPSKRAEPETKQIGQVNCLHPSVFRDPLLKCTATSCLTRTAGLVANKEDFHA